MKKNEDNSQSYKNTISNIDVAFSEKYRERKNEILFLATQAYEQHEPRKDGSPYITHPLTVSKLAYDELKNNQIPEEIIFPIWAAALLHDSVEDAKINTDCPKNSFTEYLCINFGRNCTREQIRKLKEGSTIEYLVEGVTKYPKIFCSDKKESFRKDKNKELRNALNYCNLFQYGLNNKAVFLIKLCDCVHNTSSLEAHSKIEKRQELARENLEFYIPLAISLGLYDIASTILKDSKQYLGQTPQESKDKYQEYQSIITDYKNRHDFTIETINQNLAHLFTDYPPVKNLEKYGQVPSEYAKTALNISKSILTELNIFNLELPQRTIASNSKTKTLNIRRQIAS